ncbi:MAG: DUF3313 domain-containing protein, partial [Burkholderiales bacterium]|nr:DUF3313 domain-containing protein [Burkholderiales bacterium]
HMKKTVLLGALSLSLLAACATKTVPTSQQSGFLNDYNKLQLVPNTDDGMNTYTYVSPTFKRSDYNAVMLDPVTIYQKATESITQENIYQVRQALDDSLKTAVSKQFNVVTTPGKGTARVSIAITGAEVEGEGFKPRNLMPISAVLALGAKATGLDNKQAVLLIEAKIIDSQSGALIGEAVSSMSSEKFRSEVKTKQQFQVLAEDWVKSAVKAAAGYTK